MHKKLCDEIVCFCLMHMQCSLLCPFWVACSIKGQVKQTCFNLYDKNPDFIQLLSTYWTFLKLSLRHVIIAGGGRQCEGQGCEKWAEKQWEDSAPTQSPAQPELLDGPPCRPLHNGAGDGGAIDLPGKSGVAPSRKNVLGTERNQTLSIIRHLA